MSDSLQLRLDAARRNLLDLSLRNRLINTPRGAGRSSSLEIVQELSDEVFRHLVAEQKQMIFLPASKESDKQDHARFEENWFEQPEDDEQTTIAERQRDNRLQTDLSSAALQKKLLKLFYDARTYEEEQGVNILYLALGFLRWYEDDSSSNERFAPLVLVPVQLSRSAAGARFKLAWTQEDIVTNLSLQEKLRLEFGVKLPILPEIEDLTPGQYFNNVALAISGHKRWQVLPNDIVLWFFSFSKFLMYRDLDCSLWPEDRPLNNNRLISSLLETGFRSEPPICGPSENIDRLLSARDTLHVIDADSSQAIAIEEVRRGRDLVIQGPPGTGKSQTIANIIASAVKDGKHVLFVAEKMSALEVVKRRLDHIGLGDMCLELHSHKANKRALLEELKRTLALREPKLLDVQKQAESLAECRERLNRYVEALHTPIANSGVSAFRAIGQLVRLRSMGIASAKFQVPIALSWSEKDYQSISELVGDLANHLARLGNPFHHPWRGVEATALLPTDVSNFLRKLPPIREQLNRLRQTSRGLSDPLGTAPPATLLEISQLAMVVNRITSAPPMDRQTMLNRVWTVNRQQIDTLFQEGSALAEAARQLQGVVNEAAWNAELGDIRTALERYGRVWWRSFVKKYRQESAKLKALFVDAPPKSVDERLAILNTLSRGQAARQKIEHDDQSTRIGQQAFGTCWRGIESNWSELKAICDWERACAQTTNMPDNFRALLAQPDLIEKLDGLIADIARHLKPAWKALTEATAPLQLNVKAAFGVSQWQLASLEKLEKRMTEWIDHPEGLTVWIAFLMRLKLVAAKGLKELANLVAKAELTAAEAVPHLEFAYHEAILREAYRMFPELASFDGISHETQLARFKELDQQRLMLARQEVAHAHYQRLPRHQGSSGEIGVILREINKKRRHLPIRRLLAEAGHAVQVIKPVFMMSPISVAQFLEPGMLGFDLVLIDEASQVEPVDAFGALARAQQIAVVGDDRQLPPTRFFAKLLDADGEADDTTDTADMESILGLCRAKGMRAEMLRWHYRSRHHSLIAVSNYEFYENELYVVPSSVRHGQEIGLKFHFVANGVFDRGRSATNPVEAAAVADAVMEHAHRYPGKSLGVGTFSVAQRDSILDEIELRRRAHPELEPFFNTAVPEPFFVKNLENIQGDERDVILISVGYGKDSSGYMAMHFGPLSNDGGERRLNVLITRARERCEVFSSITAADIDLNRARSWGVKALKAFLNYAEHGTLDIPQPTQREHESEFERQVAVALQAQGYEVHPQVGIAGFFIDLAVVDHENPGCYLLGIECDGARYHSLRSARDRDRLRQQVLEDRGWVIHRIWSTDWFNRPQEELRRVVAAIQEASAKRMAQVKKHNSVIDQSPSLERFDLTRHGEASRTNEKAVNTVKYVEAFPKICNAQPIHELPPQELAKVVVEIVSVEGPIHQDEVARRVASLWGLTRVGERVADAVERALFEAVHQGRIEQAGLFFSPVGQVEPPIRDRSNVGSTTLLKPEYLPPNEIRAALRAIVRTHFGISEDEAIMETVRLLGFRRTGSQLRTIIADEVDCLLRAGQLSSRNGKLYLTNAGVENGNTAVPKTR